ncbi:tRNA (guanosine(46)-N7)-methyltransferase TrmB [Bradymonas sediminis]|uniref:tRNA (guanine-N(7)-)-methyltransferase n=1 Tax=Bradymonas sediminis TaxID=1548548 RepID=A0A2Z4FK93_9DELT|nr:tRNA (guanosine(46)-N7)-methyltransferase TrmB [Bradymonas sediminis]AWV89372.1 tRNA (guanosine(46)-N7)-methyltransferase TrmB [Bradymonas sediminis]TDP73552.1 tRNA (guanine-N7-)-methyltransferase [Bradymonas sediminis]
MANLDFRFDDITEKFQAEELERIRAFGRSKTLPDLVSLEIGTNRGRFLSEVAQQFPDRYFLGAEWTALAKNARSRLKRDGVENADVLAADANNLLPILIDDGQLRELFLLFPDPWWKMKHRKRRVIQPEFLDLIAQKMPSGGNIWIRTDVGTFADDMRETLAAHPEFEPLDVFDYPLEHFPRSTRERHVIRGGIPIHTIYYKRR